MSTDKHTHTHAHAHSHACVCCVLMQAAAARQPGRAYASLVASGLMADNLTEQLAVLGIDDTSSGPYVSAWMDVFARTKLAAQHVHIHNMHVCMCSCTKAALCHVMVSRVSTLLPMHITHTHTSFTRVVTHISCADS